MNNEKPVLFNRLQIFILLAAISLLLFLLLSQPVPMPRITLQNVTQLHEILKLDSGIEGHPPDQFVLSPAGDTLIVTSGYNNELWHLTDGRKQDMNLQGAGGFTPLVFFNQDQPVAAFADWATSLSFLDLDTGLPIQRFTNTARIDLYDDWNLSPDKTWMAAKNHDQSFYVANVQTGEQRFTLTPPPGYLFRRSSPAFSPDGSVLVTALKKGEAGFAWDIVLWDVVTGQLLRALGSFPDEAVPTRIAFSHDGTQLALSGNSLARNDGRIEMLFQLWDLVSGTETGVWLADGNMAENLAFTPDDRYLVAQGLNNVWVWDLQRSLQFDNVLLYLDEDDWLPMALSKDGKLLAVGNAGSSIVIYEVATGRELVQLKGHRSRVSYLSFSDDGRLLISSGGDLSVRFWAVGNYNPYPQSAQSGATLAAPVMTPTVPGS